MAPRRTKLFVRLIVRLTSYFMSNLASITLCRAINAAFVVSIA
jgi:hypothetical protein